MRLGGIWKPLKRSLRYWALFVLLSPLERLPRPLAKKLARFLGILAWALLPGLRKRADQNLEAAFPTESRVYRRALCRRAFVWVGEAGSDFLRLGRAGTRALLEELRVEGDEYWREALASGQGVLVVSGHLGNWELLGAALAARSDRVHVLYQELRDARLERRVRRIRERAGIQPHSTSAGLLHAARALRRGEVLGVPIDQRPKGDAIVLPFLGSNCAFSLGTARLARAAHALVLPAALWGDDGGGYRLRFFPPIQGGGPVFCDVELTRRMVSALEDMVHEAPGQWPWFEDRAKPHRSARLVAPLVVALAAGVFGCVEQAPPPPPEAVGRQPQQIFDGMVLRQTTKNGLEWVLRARRGISYGNNEPLELELLHIDFYDAGNVLRSTLTSRRGEIELKTHSLEAEDSVVVLTQDGNRLESEYLRWDPDNERISTDRFFRFQRGRDLVTGIGIEADPDLEGYTVQQSVRATLQDAEAEDLLGGGTVDSATADSASGTPR